MSLKKTVQAFLLLFIFPFFAIAQLKISGKITSSEDNSPIAFVTIQAGKDQKTISNENGEFELSISSLPAIIKLTHTSFEGVVIQKPDTSRILVKLKPIVLSLKEVVIGNYALNLMKNAFEKAKETYKEPNYAKSFLRQIAFEKDKPTYLNEIYFNADWRNYGFIKWNPTQARQLKDKGMISYTNIGFFAMALSGYLFNDIHHKPLITKLDSLYTFKLKGTYELAGEVIAIISCTPKIKINKMHFEGDYFVNTATYNVLKIEGAINNMNMSSSGMMNIKNMGIDFMAQYKINSQGRNTLDFSTLNLNSRLKVLGIKAKESTFSSTLYMIDYNDVYNVDLKDINSTTNDNTTIKDMTYDANFWIENPMIMRTPREIEAVKALEKVKQENK